jgi:hypothetical protein
MCNEEYDDRITEISAMRNAISIVENKLNHEASNLNLSRGKLNNSNNKPILYSSDGRVIIPIKHRRKKQWHSNKKAVTKEDMVHFNWFGHGRFWTMIAILFV